MDDEESKLINGHLAGFHMDKTPSGYAVTPGEWRDTDGNHVSTTEDLAVDTSRADKPDTWYAIWVIADHREPREGRMWEHVYAVWQWVSDHTGCRPPPQETVTLVSESFDGPTLPPGYRHKRRVGAMRSQAEGEEPLVGLHNQRRDNGDG